MIEVTVRFLDCISLRNFPLDLTTNRLHLSSNPEHKHFLNLTVFNFIFFSHLPTLLCSKNYSYFGIIFIFPMFHFYSHNTSWDTKFLCDFKVLLNSHVQSNKVLESKRIVLFSQNLSHMQIQSARELSLNYKFLRKRFLSIFVCYCNS